MNNDKALNLLGMARRADKLSLGHDASEASIKANQASVCVVSCDASDRLRKDMLFLCEGNNKKIKLIECDYTMNELGMALGAKTTAVLTVNDMGFANRITELIGRNNDI